MYIIRSADQHSMFEEIQFTYIPCTAQELLQSVLTLIYPDHESWFYLFKVVTLAVVNNKSCQLMTAFLN